MAYPPSTFNPLKENNVESFASFEDEYDPEYDLFWSYWWNRKPNSYLLVCEKREKEEEEQSRVFLVRQQLAEVSHSDY